jgi:hypothetical protein
MSEYAANLMANSQIGGFDMEAKMSRRDFVKKCGMGVAAVATGAVVAAKGKRANGTPELQGEIKKGISPSRTASNSLPMWGFREWKLGRREIQRLSKR